LFALYVFSICLATYILYTYTDMNMIVGYLKPSGKYFIYIQGKNKFNII